MTTKPLAEQSPSEIDVQLAALYEEMDKARYNYLSAVSAVHYAAGDKRVGWNKPQWKMTFDEAVAKVEATIGSDKIWEVRKAQEALELLGDAKAKVAEVADRTKPFNEEFTRRGGWTRAFLATSSTNPHVHNGMDCSTCNRMGTPTRFGWFPEYSGRPESEIVEDAGERACTVCYPSAPVAVLSRPTKFFTEDEKTKALAKVEREAKRAKALAEKIVVEGVIEWGDRPQTKEFKSLRAATQFATSQRTDILWWNADHPSAYRWETNARVVEEAIAAKTGQSVEAVRADIETRSKATLKRRKAG